MLNINKNIINLFSKYNITWYINISQTNNISIEYNPLYDEVSFDNNKNITTTLCLIKNHKKWVYNIDWFSEEKIDSAIQELLNFINFWEYDKNIVLAPIKDQNEFDFSNKDLLNIEFCSLEKEFNKFKNFKFQEKIKIEWFSIWVKNTQQIFLNSFWSIKTQKDNASFCYIELFWENKNNRDSHYDYIENKKKPIISTNLIKNTQDLLLKKIDNKNKTIKSWFYDIVLDKDVVIDFLEIILENLSAEEIREWISLFSKYKIWDKIFNDNFTLINNPNLKWYTWNILFDNEWINAKKTILFKNWILNAKFCNYKNFLKEWKKYLWNSTISNIELKPWKYWNPLEWCKIIFTNLMAFHTVDTSTWNYSLNWEWFLIENWEKTDFIKNISLSWNIIDLFSKIKHVWNDFKKDWNFKVPSISFYNQKII